MTYLDGLVITLGKYVCRYRRRSIVDDNHCLVEASEWIEVGLLRTLPCFFVACSAYLFESLASYHGWDCILQGVCVHVMRVEGVHDGHGSVIFRYFFSRIQYVPHSYGVISSASNLYLGSLLARLKNPSDCQLDMAANSWPCSYSTSPASHMCRPSWQAPYGLDSLIPPPHSEN